jgi:predicted nucleotidyltransferase
MNPLRRQQAADEQTQRRVREALRAAFCEQPEVLLAYVHGSFATGHPFRDLDLAVLLRDEVGDALLSSELGLEAEVGEILRRIGFTSPVDLKTLNRAPLSFRYQVIKTGFPVFARDDTVRVTFETSTVSRYLDFAPFRREQLREVLRLGVR